MSAPCKAAFAQRWEARMSDITDEEIAALEPRCCPLPGACSAVAQIAQLRRERGTAYARGLLRGAELVGKRAHVGELMDGDDTFSASLRALEIQMQGEARDIFRALAQQNPPAREVGAAALEPFSSPPAGGGGPTIPAQDTEERT